MFQSRHYWDIRPEGQKSKCSEVWKIRSPEVWKTKSPDGQKSDCPEVRMARSLKARSPKTKSPKAKSLEVQMEKCPEI